MDGLRWYLLLFGLFVVAGVYLYSRMQRNKADSGDSVSDELPRQEPSLDGESLPEKFAGAGGANQRRFRRGR